MMTSSMKSLSYEAVQNPLSHAEEGGASSLAGGDQRRLSAGPPDTTGPIILTGCEKQPNVHVWSRIASSPSLLIIAYITFIGDATRGIFFPVLLKQIQHLGGSSYDQGFLVATYSLGRLLSTTPFGYLCDTHQHRLPLVLANVILLCAAMLWANAYYFGLPALYIAQFGLGFGAGMSGITRSYVVQQTVPEHRTDILAFMAALQYAGFAISPLLGSVMMVAGSGSAYWMLSLPAYVMALLALYGLIAVGVVFQNISSEPKSTVVKKSAASEGSLWTMLREERNQVIVLFIALNFITKGCIAVYETLSTPIGAADFDIVSQSMGLLVSIGGIIGFLQLVFFNQLYTRRYDDMQLIQGGILLMILASAIYLCSPDPTKAQFVISVIVMYGFGFPIGHTALLGAFSKIQKSGPQGALLGFFSTAGSLGRIVLAVMSGYCDRGLDNSPFLINILLLVSSLGMLWWYALPIMRYIK